MRDTDVVVTPPARQGEVRLGDGRRLAWSEWGPEDGAPVLFCTGAATSGSLGFGMGDVDDLGVRLLAIDRPGLGRSDPHPEKTLLTWVDDVREMVRQARLGTPLAAAFSQGAPFALALAGRGVARAVAVASGQDQLSHPRIRPLLHPDVAAMLAAAERDAAAFERHFAGMATAEGFWALVAGMSGETDLRLYGSETFAPAFRRAVEEAFARGADGYARDLANALGPWPVEPEEVTVPVQLWYGGRDTSPVHSPDGGVTLAARFPNASHVLDPEEGGSILWTRSREILETLLASAPRRHGER